MNPIEQAALAVLEAEMLYTDAVALRNVIDAPALKIDLDTAQTTYETEILARTTAVGAIA